MSLVLKKHSVHINGNVAVTFKDSPYLFQGIYKIYHILFCNVIVENFEENVVYMISNPVVFFEDIISNMETCI